MISSSNDRRHDSDHLRRYADFVAGRDKIARKFKKTQRTEKDFPILVSEPVFERPVSKWSAADYVRKITFEITGLHTFHAQENLVILREYLNEFIIEEEAKLLEDSSMRLGTSSFYTRNRRDGFSYDFQSKNKPTKADFLKAMRDFLSLQT